MKVHEDIYVAYIPTLAVLPYNQVCGVGGKISDCDLSKISDSDFPKFSTPTP